VLGPVEEPLRSDALDAVLLYSPRSAKIWRGLVGRAGLDAEAARVMHLCLSRNVAGALPEDWKALIAASPDEAAMLALLEQCRGTL